MIDVFSYGSQDGKWWSAAPQEPSRKCLTVSDSRGTNLERKTMACAGNNRMITTAVKTQEVERGPLIVRDPCEPETGRGGRRCPEKPTEKDC